MADAPRADTGTIYDIGYRHYDGERLGRGYAIRSLVEHDLGTIFAVGRGFRAKLIPLVLAAFAILPAVVQAGASAYLEILPEILGYANYVVRLYLVFALFCAARAPALVSADQSTNTLVLYFARALHRTDYALAKVLALSISLFALTATPLMVLFAGQVFGSAEPLSTLWADSGDLVFILISSLVVALLMSSVSLAIASRTARSRLAAAGVLGYFILAAAVTEILTETIDAAWSEWIALLNPFIAIGGFADWLFDAPAAFGGPSFDIGIPEWGFGLACLAYIALAVGILLARYRGLDT